MYFHGVICVYVEAYHHLFLQSINLSISPSEQVSTLTADTFYVCILCFCTIRLVS